MLTGSELSIVSLAKKAAASLESEIGKLERVGLYSKSIDKTKEVIRIRLAIHVLENNNLTGKDYECLVEFLSGYTDGTTLACGGTGIGYMAIGRSVSECAVFTISSEIGAVPPYGEFALNEFNDIEFTKEITV